MSSLYGQLADWIALLLRWTHVIAGIAWIGSSFYFVALDSGLKKDGPLDPGVGGESWQVHGGGFYRIQKFTVAPSSLPRDLTWFMWEAYSTWLFGVALMVFIYYRNPSLYLVDPAVASLSPAAAVAISALLMPVMWLIYDRMCRSALGKSTVRLTLTGMGLLAVTSWGVTHLFSGRGAFIEFGVLTGTVMAGNVFFVIIPNQRKVIGALIAGQKPDPALGIEGKKRSIHNNYLTLPVIFMMISNHYPFLYNNPQSWMIVVGVFVSGFLIRHYFNLHHQGLTPPAYLVLAAAAVMLAVIGLTLKPEKSGAAAVDGSFAHVQGIIATRCAVCHAEKPIFGGIDAAPKGVLLDSPARIKAQAALIYQQAVEFENMPIGNATNITDEEREAIAAWFRSGAKGK